jgi:glutathione synthase/RimK-type ligase-like ATP-grasp enzyme
MLPGRPETRDDHWELDFELEPIRAACAQRGIAVELAVWDDPALDPRAHDAWFVGTPWDYTRRPAQFLDVLARIEGARPLFNPLAIVRWNSEKTYLADLAARGAPSIPTVWGERADHATIARAFDELACDEVVVKPLVGASAWRQSRVRRGEPLPAADELPLARCLIQPYLPSVAEEGEYSFLFFGGEFSHVAQKVPARGDYRVQSRFGAREHVHVPSPAEIALARRVVDAVGVELLYARVDMVRAPDGGLVVMELELIEPYLYPEQGPRMGELFAEALERRLAAL